MEWLTKLFGGLGNAASSGMSGIGGALSKGASGIGNMGSQLLGGLSNMFGGGGGGSVFKGSTPGLSNINPNNYSGMMKNSPSALMALNQNKGFSGISSMGAGLSNAFVPAAKKTVNSLAQGGSKSNLGGNVWNALKGFGKSDMAGPALGLGTLFGSQLIQNPKAPALPDEFQQHMKMMQGGGTPGMQAAQNYNMNILSGQDQNAYNAAVEGVDQAFEQEMEQLKAAYRSARPGLDITNDAAFKRDAAELEQRYAQRKALVMAQVQQGASQALAGLGSQQMGGMQGGIEALIGNQNTQLGMDYDKTSGFRNTLGNLGMGMFQGPMQMKMMQKMFGGG